MDSMDNHAHAQYCADFDLSFVKQRIHQNWDERDYRVEDVQDLKLGRVPDAE